MTTVIPVQYAGLLTTNNIITDDFLTFQAQLRKKAVQNFEDNRRSGGIKTQKSVVKAFQVRRGSYMRFKLTETYFQKFLRLKLSTKELRDDIVDEHCLLLWIEYNATRLKLDRKGTPIPNTRVGAVSYQIL